jgi:hypothetical protein
VFSGVFVAEEVDGLGDVGLGETTVVMYRHSQRHF